MPYGGDVTSDAPGTEVERALCVCFISALEAYCYPYCLFASSPAFKQLLLSIQDTVKLPGTINPKLAGMNAARPSYASLAKCVPVVVDLVSPIESQFGKGKVVS